jgi:hypothetical protein
MTTRYRSFVAPRLPTGSVDYSAEEFDRFTNVLRLYFNQLDNWNNTLMQDTGGRFVGNPYGAWHDTTTQTAAANTPTLITMNSTDFTQTVTLVAGSKITAKYPGIYNVQFSIQLSNPNTSDDNVTIWYKQNGVDVVNSAGIATVNGKHGSTPGTTVFGWNEFFDLNANDYLQLYWTTDSGNTTLATYAAGVSPTHPASPSVAVSAQFVSAQPT